MKKKSLKGLSLNKKTITALNDTVQGKIVGGSQSCYTGTYNATCCGTGGGSFPNTGTVWCTGTTGGC